jgi:integrase/recombinase XerD
LRVELLHGFLAHVPLAGVPIISLLEQQHTDKAHCRCDAWKNTDDACSASYLAIDTLNGIRTRNAAPVLPRKRHERQRITEPILQNLHRFTARFLVLRPERFIRGERGFGIRLVIDALQIAGELFLVRLRRMRRYVASEIPAAWLTLRFLTLEREAIMVTVLKAQVTGPLESYALEFAAKLLGQGYTASGASQHLGFIAHLSRWMARTNLGVSALTPPVITEYLSVRCAAGYVNYRSVKAFRPLLEYLGALGVLPPPEMPALHPAATLLETFRQYLIGERGLTSESARVYIDAVRAFVFARVRVEGQQLGDLSARDITDFLLESSAKRSRKLQVTALRALLNWLHVEGVIPSALVGSVLPVAAWRLTSLPRALEPDQVKQLLDSCDQRFATGRRDYAILLLLSRLGLRSGEVARLRLDDIDWRIGEMVLQGKGNRFERLPLPVDVGKAILDYVRLGRPCTTKARNVFVRVKAPHRAPTSGGLSMVVFDAGQRAGLGKIHAHRLRHTAATAMLRAGTPLAEVGQVLRHRRVLTTAIYAKVDRDALRVLARPWPGAVS